MLFTFLKQLPFLWHTTLKYLKIVFYRIYKNYKNLTQLPENWHITLKTLPSFLIHLPFF